MKRIIVLLLVLVLCCSLFAGCEMLPESITEKLGLSKVEDNTPAHEHEFVLKEDTATCTKKGKATYECACGEKKVEDSPASHSYKVAKTENPTCTKPGNYKYKCEKCGGQKNESFGSPTGHNVGEFVEQSRLITCQNPNCSYGIWPEGNGKYAEVIVFKFTDADVERFNVIHAELAEIIEAADAYDASLHAYELGSATHDAYLVMEAKYEELYDVLEYITAQYQIANLEYSVYFGNKDKEAALDNISKVRTDLVSQFYSFSEAIYNSMYREYYYEGMTEEEILAFIFESNAVANPEYKKLVDRNNEIELEYNALANTGDDEVPILYAEFVANNKKLAELLGYDNYLEYAYENVYDRDYSYTDVQVIFDNVKKYISPVFNTIYGEFNEWQTVNPNANDLFNKYTGGSFFSNAQQNVSLNDYIDLLTINGNKTMSFSDEFNALMGDGNMFRGIDEGAYVTSLYGMDLPIAYFGTGYDDFFTVAHEFGHYMNEKYSGGEYNQSYDLLEMHSQGNEMLFLAYLNNNPEVITAGAVQFYNIYQPLNIFYAAMHGVAVDAFERAVYTDYYEGIDAKEIMDYDEESGLYITYDEYDLLYSSILKDLGGQQYMSTDYWRLGMTFSSPCYYVSYSVSALSVMQLLPMGMENFDAASDAYLKLFSYVDEYSKPNAEYMTTEETLLYAGLMSFKDEELYKYINEYFMAMFA